MVIIKNYQVEEQIYESSNSRVYRGVRKVDSQAVILKLLQGEYPTRQQLTNYRQEYEMTRSMEMMVGGAVAKVQQLEELYPELRVQTGRSSSGETLSAVTNRTGGHMLDLASVMKASQAISGEIKLENLLAKMIQIVVENAGAERGLLILCQSDSEWLLQARCEVGLPSGGLKDGELSLIEPQTHPPRLELPQVAKPEWALPPVDRLQQFYILAKMGKMMALEKAAADMAGADETLKPFAHHVMTLARGFEDETLLTLFEKYLK